MVLDKGEVQEFQTQFLAAEWERQHQERQIARERLQDEATVELLDRWSVQRTTRRQRQQASRQQKNSSERHTW